MNLEDELRSALRRQDPSPGFAGRVIARARPAPPHRSRRPMLAWAASVAAMLALSFGAVTEYRRVQAERARDEAVLALQIAAEKLNHIRDKVFKEN
jgi:hypothetical protein